VHVKGIDFERLQEREALEVDLGEHLERAVTVRIQPLVRSFKAGKAKRSFDAGYMLWQTARALVRLYEIESKTPGAFDPYHGINSLYLERITLHEDGHCTVVIGT